MRLLAYSLAVFIILTSCKKKSRTEGYPTNPGKEDAERIAELIAGKRYKVAFIYEEESKAEAKDKFPPCIMDDIYFFKDDHVIQIIQGEQKCGQNSQDTIDAEWSIEYDQHEITSFKFPFFQNSDSSYESREFKKGFYKIVTEVKSISLIFKIDNKTYVAVLLPGLHR